MLRSKLCIVSVLLAAVVSVSQATVWTGIADSAWSNDGNWDAGLPGDAVFSGAVTANQPNIAAAASGTTVSFNSGGWTISSDDGAGGLGQLSLWAGSGTNAVASNSGVNVIDANLFFSAYSNTQLYAEAGSTLVVNGDISGRRDWHAYGSGTYIFNGDAAKLLDDYGQASVFFNGSAAATVGAPTIAAGNTIGGAAPVMIVNNYSSVVLEDGAIFAPGDTGPDAPGISTLTFQSTGTSRSGFDMGGELSKMLIDIGTAAGENDQIIVDFPGEKLTFNLHDCELALRGTGTIADGDYTLITETGAGVYSGMFGSVTFNGAALGSENYQIAYNEDSVVLTLTNVPEPASMLLLALGSAAIIRKRR